MAGFGVVMRHEMRSAEAVSETASSARHLLVVLLARGLEQRRVGGLLHQRVLEQVDRGRGRPARLQQARVDQALELVAQRVGRERRDGFEPG
jgi:hypothetical protein